MAAQSRPVHPRLPPPIPTTAFDEACPVDVSHTKAEQHSHLNRWPQHTNEVPVAVSTLEYGERKLPLHNSTPKLHSVVPPVSHFSTQRTSVDSLTDLISSLPPQAPGPM